MTQLGLFLSVTGACLAGVVIGSIGGWLTARRLVDLLVDFPRGA